MFYDQYLRLCNSIGKSPSAVALEIGVAKSTVTRWKTGSKPNDAVLIKIADYFGVTPDVLTGEPQKEKAAIDVVDDDLQEYLDVLRSRPEMRMLFSTTKTAKKSEIEAIVSFIEKLRGAENDVS